MSIEVELPDGSVVEFPDGTSKDVMQNALRSHAAKTPMFSQAAFMPSGLGPAQKQASQNSYDEAPALLPNRELSHAFLRGEPDPGVLGQLGHAATMAFPPALLAKGLAGGDTYPASKEGAMDFLRYTSPQDLQKVLAAQGATMREGPRGTVIVTNSKGEDAVLNRPGFSPEDFRGAGVNLAPFMIPGVGPEAGMFAGPVAKAALQGAVGGTIREGLDAAVRPMVGAETDPAQAAKNIAFDTIMSGIMQKPLQGIANLGTKLAGSGFDLLRKLAPTSQAAQQLKFTELRKAFDAQKIKVTDTELAQVQSLLKQTDDPQAALRWLESQQNNVPLTQGQVTGDKVQLGKEARLTKMESGQAPSIMEQQYQAAKEALQNRAQDLRAAAGADPSRIGENLGAVVQDPLLGARESAYKNVQDLYKAVPDSAAIETRFLRAKPKGSEASPFEDIAGVAKNFNNTAPKAFGIFTDLRGMIYGKQPIRFKQDWEAVRGQLGDLMVGSDATEAKAARAIRDAMDGAVDRAAKAGGVTPEALPAIEAARAARKEFGAQFEGNDIISTLTGRQWRSGTVAPAVDPAEVSKKVLGSGSNTIAFRDNFVQDMGLLKARLPADQWAAVRADAFDRMLNKIEGASSQKALDGARDYLASNEQKLLSVLEPDDLAKLHSYARIKSAASMRGVAAPSGGAMQTASRAITTATMALGAEGAGQALGLPPAVGFGGALTLGSLLSKMVGNKMAAAQAAKAVAPKLMPVQQPNPYYNLGAPATSILDYLRAMEAQQQ